MRYICVLLLFALFPVFAQEKAEESNEEKNPVVIMKTNHGEIEIELFPKSAPETVKNFIDLADGKKEFTDAAGNKVTKPFYDGLIFHRVIKGFMIQGGCPKGDGTGDGGYKFKDEINAKSLGLDKEKAVNVKTGQPSRKIAIYPPQQQQSMILRPIYKKLGIVSKETFEAKKNEFSKALEELTIHEVYKNLGYGYDEKLKSFGMLKGYIAMANSGPNTNGTQFFINLVDNKYLDGKHTVFGKVTKGFDIVEKIGAVKVNGSTPADPVKIESIRSKTK